MPKMDKDAMAALKSAVYLGDFCLMRGCYRCPFTGGGGFETCKLRGTPKVWSGLERIKIRGYFKEGVQ